MFSEKNHDFMSLEVKEGLVKPNCNQHYTVIMSGKHDLLPKMKLQKNTNKNGQKLSTASINTNVYFRPKLWSTRL